MCRRSVQIACAPFHDDGNGIGQTGRQILLAPPDMPCRHRQQDKKAVVQFPQEEEQMTLARITLDPLVMGGKPCIRGLRVTVGTVVGLIASGHSEADILKAYPYLEAEDLREALAYAAWHLERANSN
jgi:uncharacterized protein (DUF433 family)